MDGFQLRAALRLDPRLADLKVVAVSASGDTADRQQTAAAGFVTTWPSRSTTTRSSRRWTARSSSTAPPESSRGLS